MRACACSGTEVAVAQEQPLSWMESWQNGRHGAAPPVGRQSNSTTSQRTQSKEAARLRELHAHGLHGCAIARQQGRAVSGSNAVCGALRHATVARPDAAGAQAAPTHSYVYGWVDGRGAQVVRRNMLLADWHDEDHKESLMNDRQGKWAKEMIDNVRLACCVAGVRS